MTLASCLHIWAACCIFGVDQRGDRWIAAQLLHAPAAAGPDAPEGDAQPGADLGVWHGRVFEEHGDQPLARWWQAGEGLAERHVTLRQEQLMFRHPGLLVRDALNVQPMPESMLVPRRPQGPDAFPLSGGGKPAGANRCTSACHASESPFLAHRTRSAVGESLRMAAASPRRGA